jgi:hypothetical protein
MEQYIFLPIAAFLATLVGLVGKNRKIGFGWSFVLSLFLSPVIGLIITLFSKKKDVQFVDINREKH